ncbi:uncharacterized protein [Littorina saxatilis]|uniref:uncharacterized protein n=1 Tax=Littorina saxatilis TaxID=31220 RepID=UPI0038B670E0
MITNDLYEGCDTTRSPVELDYTDVHDAIQPARDGTPGATTVDTFVAAGVSLQAGVSAQAGAELGDMDDGDYEEISPRQPAVPTRGQQHVRQQLPPTTLTPPKPCHSSEVTGDYADVE